MKMMKPRKPKHQQNLPRKVLKGTTFHEIRDALHLLAQPVTGPLNNLKVNLVFTCHTMTTIQTNLMI